MDKWLLGIGHYLINEVCRMKRDKLRVDELKTAEMITETSGRKSLTFETYQVDSDSNTIGVKVVSEDGTICNKVNEDAGNAIAVAMDVLLGRTLPVGTKFHVNIDFDTEV